MNPDDHIHVEQIGDIALVEISDAMQRVFDRADTDPRMMQLDRLMAEAEDSEFWIMLLDAMAQRMEELALMEEMQ
ncbi:hypothetical protein HF289_00700 [Acidithiobacillus ferrooxidans]|uniref:hypothetical protein n=1 Tax=Acidithiobacillus ferrooxidans TaxID=920 RepID=UPI001C06C011|nr:hypothetical protein [Acidithiobacillus ferrooxidans]MBU2855442.1 hypothetical protein [Acidithiobacillus ferrooxidans]MBU2861010.1 hypothetical protein [Acidithiobacillus ferrooxidans]